MKKGRRALGVYARGGNKTHGERGESRYSLIVGPRHDGLPRAPRCSSPGGNRRPGRYSVDLGRPSEGKESKQSSFSAPDAPAGARAGGKATRARAMRVGNCVERE